MESERPFSNRVGKFQTHNTMSSVNEDIKQMQAQIEKYGSVTQFGIRVQQIDGPGAQEGNTGSITAASGGTVRSDSGASYDAGWEIGNWGDTMTFTKR